MTLSLQRPDDRGGLGSMEKWSNSGWGSSQQQPMLEGSMFFPHPQSQSMFPQLMEQQALVQAFVANADQNALLPDSTHTLLSNNSSRSSSMVDSTSDDDCNTAPENLQINCIAALGGGPLASVLDTGMLDRTASTGTSLKHESGFFSPGGPLSPNALRESEDSQGGCCFKRRLDEEVAEGEWMEQIHRSKMSKVQDIAAFPGEMAFDAALAMPPPPPFLPGGSCSPPVLDMDKLASMRAILFRHASQPVPSLEEIASTRPKRRNVRISKDPQSVAARLRRERISDRIRVLQRLVPGGTKMDTASMLDEAIHYVKFLKLQLQTLEQIGTNNNGDVRGFQQSSLVRPFDLNCAQAWPAPPTSMVHHTAASSQQHQQQAVLPWATDANHAFADANARAVLSLRSEVITHLEATVLRENH